MSAGRADKHRRVGALGCPAEPVTKFRVGVGRVHQGQYTAQIKLGCEGRHRETCGGMADCAALKELTVPVKRRSYPSPIISPMGTDLQALSGS